MCGICGFTGATDSDAPILKSMCDIMAHRGPDGEGQYLADGIAFGHRRLSLIDLEGGLQPMVRETTEKDSRVTSPSAKGGATFARGDCAIVFNGEIYNYQDLKAQLEQEGWKFQTTSDTEVLLVSYLAWGEDLLQRIRGMFAFAIWDAAKQELFCARDFFGIKPFYYTQQNGQFIFASEIKCILEHPAYERELNTEALDQYLCFQFSTLPETFFKGVFKLAPAHCMHVHADGSIDTARYWTPDYQMDTARSYDDTVDAIDAVMQDSVKYHNVADVEVGSFLSSGIDSSYLAASLHKQSGNIKTFTVGFSEYSGERDEISWARELCDELDIENHSRTINEKDFWTSLPRVQWHMDEPSADPSAVALYFVDSEAAKRVKAVLSGEGADEFFGGYKIYQTPFANQKLSWCPRPVLRGASHALRALHLRGANYLERASETVEDWYYTNANGVAFSFEEAHKLLKHSSTTVTPQQLCASTYARVKGLDETTRMQYLDLHFWLIGDILLKTDKMSMAHSLESRVPFLDKEVWNVARTIPTKFKANDEQTKIALRDSALRYIPKDWAQKEKLGFPVPLKMWLQQDEYYAKVKGWLTDDVAAQFFNTGLLMALLDEHKAGVKDNSRKIWIVAMFLMWYRIYFIDRTVPEKPAV